MSKINFSDAYYANLIQATATYGNLFVTDDGNIYRTQMQAESRMKDALKVRRIVRWCEIKKGKEPLSNEELDKLFDDQFAISSREINAPAAPKEQRIQKPAMSLTDAMSELEKRRKSKSAPKKDAKAQ